jgi:hypothetical protein
VRDHFPIVGVGTSVYSEIRMKTPVLSPPGEETSPQADRIVDGPPHEVQPQAAPETTPQRKKREMPALALVVTLLGLALLLMIPAIIILTRIQP